MMKTILWSITVIITLMTLPEALLRLISPNLFRKFLEIFHHSPNLRRWRLGAISYMVLAGIMFTCYWVFPNIWRHYLAIISFWFLWVLIDWAFFRSYRQSGIMLQISYLLVLSCCFYFLPQITWASFIFIVMSFGLRGFIQLESIPIYVSTEIHKTDEMLRQESTEVIIVWGVICSVVYWFNH